MSLSDGSGGLFGFASGTNILTQNFALTGTKSGFAAPNSGDSLTLAGRLTGNASLVIGRPNDSGTVVLTNPTNSYTGTTISGGTLSVGTSTTSGSLGNGNIALRASLYNAPVALTFNNTSSAGSRTIAGDINSSISFNDYASAGNASFANNGTINFNDASGAGDAQIVSTSFYVYGGGVVNFKGTSNANNAAITNNGMLNFYNTANAGNATVTSGNSGTVGNNGGYVAVNFYNSAKAGSAMFIGTGSGSLYFNDTSGAGNATINQSVFFRNSASAENALITGGSAQFDDNSSAGTATINGNGGFSFQGNSSGGNATLSNNGEGTISSFEDSSDAGTARITNNALFGFDFNSTADNATFINNSAGTLDLRFRSNGLSIGRLSGEGAVILSKYSLTVGGAVTSSGVRDMISGQISGSGSLVKAGAGTLLLSGANTYKGGTTISTGTVVASGGSLSSAMLNSGGLGVGAVTIASGATLSVGQAVNASGTALPGYSSVALSSLTLNGGSGDVPLLTFNLGTNGGVDGSNNDLLRFSGDANTLIFSGAGGFPIGFASGSGGDITGRPSYLLMSFAIPVALSSATVADPNTKLTGVGTGNLRTLNGGSFSWATSGGNITGLQYHFVNADATPEPGAVALFAATLPIVGVRVLRRKRG